MSVRQGDGQRQCWDARLRAGRCVRWRWIWAFTAAISLALAATPDAFAKPRQGQAARYASIIVDAETGTVLQATAPDDQRYPASLTKIMTLYMVFEALDSGRLKLHGRIPVSAHAANQSPTKLGLEEGDLVMVRDVVLGLITKSANDAAVVAAEALAGDEERFARLMTQTARRIGMSRTTFQNASGLPHPDQVTTARDMATLARALVRRFPHYYGYFSTAEFTYAGVSHPNHNRLMSWYSGADGIKTGFIRASGFNLVASAVRDNRRLIGVVLGGTSATARDQQMARLLDDAFRAAERLPATRYAGTPSFSLIGAANAAPTPEPPTTPPRRAGETSAPNVAYLPGDRAAVRPILVLPPSPVVGEWGIQVGAFSTARAAGRATDKAKSVAPGHLSLAKAEVATQSAKRARLHRAWLVGLDETRAREACRALERKKMGCFVLSPDDLRGQVRVAVN